jgi:glutaredoxin
MKITIYTVSDCKFSQAEKEYLKSKSLAFEEKNLETNRDFLTEMLQKSNNFAGTPVTEIVKDDGTTMVIKVSLKLNLMQLSAQGVLQLLQLRIHHYKHRQLNLYNPLCNQFRNLKP